MEADQGGGG